MLSQGFLYLQTEKKPEGNAGPLSVAQGLHWQHKRDVKLNKRLKEAQDERPKLNCWY